MQVQPTKWAQSSCSSWPQASQPGHTPITPGDFSVFLANIKVCVLFWLVSACFVSRPFAYLANLCYALLLALSTRHNIRVWPRTWLRARLQVPTRATGRMRLSATSFCLLSRRCLPCRIMNHCSGFSLVCLCACVERWPIQKIYQTLIMKFLSQVNTSAVKQSEQLLLSAFINDFGMGSPVMRCS